MNQPIHINSPCISVCVINAQTGYCQGCYRTIDEISGWPQLSPQNRVEIIHQLEARRQTDGD